MAIIIPSKNIFEKSNDKVIDNVIENATIPLTTFAEKVGNVSETDLSFSFYEANTDENNNTTIVPLFNNGNELTSSDAPVDYTTNGVKFKIIYANSGIAFVPDKIYARAKISIKVSPMVVFEFSDNLPAYFNSQKHNFWFEKQAISIDNISINKKGTLLKKSPPSSNTSPYGGYQIQSYDNENRTMEIEIGFVIRWSEFVDVQEADGSSSREMKNFYSTNVNLELRSGYLQEETSETNGQNTDEKIWVSPTNNLMQKDFGLDSVVKSQYENGKETATIRCSIGDYYDYSGSLSISRKTIIKNHRYNFLGYVADNTDHILIYAVLQEFSSSYPYVLKHDFIATKVDGSQEIITLSINAYEREISKKLDKSQYLSAITKGHGYGEIINMCFKVGDEVIPMVYGADGKDRPLSLYKDGTDKVFRVLKSKIFYDGAVWQELHLQEV